MQVCALEPDMTDFLITATHDDRCTIDVSGELDIAAVDDLLGTAESCLGHTPTGLTIDLGQVTFIDSSGLGALVRVRKSATQRHLGFALVAVPESLQRLFTITGLSGIFAEPSGG